MSVGRGGKPTDPRRSRVTSLWKIWAEGGFPFFLGMFAFGIATSYFEGILTLTRALYVAFVCTIGAAAFAAVFHYLIAVPFRRRMERRK